MPRMLRDNLNCGVLALAVLAGCVCLLLWG